MLITSTDSMGAQQYMKVYDGPASGIDVPLDIDVNSKADVFVGGYSQSSGGDLDMAVLMYAPVLVCRTPTGLYSSDITTSSVILHWNAVPEALKYTVQYRPVGTGTWALSTSPVNSITLTGLLSKTKYQWRVRTVCSANPSVTSSFTSGADTFVTPTLLMPVITYNNTNQSIHEIKPQVFPNPVKNMVNITLNNTQEGAVNITISDMSGRQVQQYQFTHNGAVFSKQVDISKLIAGSYVISISNGSAKYSQILIKE
jgi:hypothetical protein